MKVELKQIVNQLTETIGLPLGQKVSALIDDDESIVGWTIVDVSEDGTIKPISKQVFANVKELVEEFVVKKVGEKQT